MAKSKAKRKETQFVEHPTKVFNVLAFGKHCNGCQRHGADVMLTVVVDDVNQDFFLDQKQAEKLAALLNEVVEDNKREGQK